MSTGNKNEAYLHIGIKEFLLQSGNKQLENKQQNNARKCGHSKILVVCVI